MAASRAGELPSVEAVAPPPLATIALDYALGVSRLLACPFCRELYPDTETDRCPECGVDLAPLEALPPSLDVIAEAAAAGELVPPEDRPVSPLYWRRGRGALLVLAVLGLVFFFSPWVSMTRPDEALISGFDLARGRAGWLWGGAIGWFIVLPLVASRRTIRQMRGVRIVTAMFAAMTAIEIAMLVSLPPQGSRYLRVEFAWAWGLWASAAVSVVGVAFGARFGGRLDDLPKSPWEDAAGNLRVDDAVDRDAADRVVH